MADRTDFHFRQRVTESELDEPFDRLELADVDLALDTGHAQKSDVNGVPTVAAAAGDFGAMLGGIMKGLKCTYEAPGTLPTVNLRILVSAGICYDPRGRRIAPGYIHNASTGRQQITTPSYVIDAAAEGDTPVGEGGSTTGGAAVAPPGGQTRVITLMVLFDRLLVDPRVDGNAATVYFERNESFRFRIKMGNPSAGTPVPPPPDADTIILGDFTINSASQIIAEDYKRRGDYIRGNLDGVTIPAAQTTEGASDIIQGDARHALLRLGLLTGGANLQFAAHVNQAAPANKHAAKNIDYAASSELVRTGANKIFNLPAHLGGGAATDGLQKTIDDLIRLLGKQASDPNVYANEPIAGSYMIGTQALGGTVYGLAGKWLEQDLSDLLNHINDHVTKGAVTPTAGFAHETTQLHAPAITDGSLTSPAGSLDNAILYLLNRITERGHKTQANTWTAANLYTNDLFSDGARRYDRLLVDYNQSWIGFTDQSGLSYNNLVAEGWRVDAFGNAGLVNLTVQTPSNYLGIRFQKTVEGGGDYVALYTPAAFFRYTNNVRAVFEGVMRITYAGGAPIGTKDFLVGLGLRNPGTAPEDWTQFVGVMIECTGGVARCSTWTRNGGSTSQGLIGPGALTSNQEVAFRIEITGTTNVRYWINNVSLDVAVDLPATNTLMQVGAGFKVSGAGGESDSFLLGPLRLRHRDINIGTANW